MNQHIEESRRRALARFNGELPRGWDEDPFADTADEGSEEYGSPSGQPYLDKHDIDGPSR